MNQLSEKEYLEVSQMLENHPLKTARYKYKIKYIGVLEHIVNRFSPKNKWADSVIKLYKKVLLDNCEADAFPGLELKKASKGLLSYKLYKWKIVTFRYCFFIDCMFINAFNNREEALKLFQNIAEIYSKGDRTKIGNLFNELYSGGKAENYSQTDYLRECWRRNKSFLDKPGKNILITANMSAGKSTLLNALVGKKVNKTQNEACTAQLHFIMNKAYEDNYSYELDYELELDADYQTLMDDNPNNLEGEISVGTRFKSVFDIDTRVCLIDTPGVNSAVNREHREVTEAALKNESYNNLIYLLNGENIGTTDDRRYLEYICDNYKGNVIFVVNKLDKFVSGEDSVAATLNRVNAELTKIGFKNPAIYPVSAYAGYLAKMKIFGQELNKRDGLEYDMLKEDLKTDDFRLDRYYPEAITAKVKEFVDDEDKEVLMYSGLLSLEYLLYN